MSFLNKQIQYAAGYKQKVWIGLILALFLSFVIIFLEPFDTNQFHSNHRLLLLSGFGILLFGAFVTYSSLENLWYVQVKKVWLFWHEALSTLLFFVFSGSILFVYNSLVINQNAYSFTAHLLYLRTIVLLMIPLIAPLLIYLRQKFGERILPLAPNSFLVQGENKNEKLILEKQNVLFVKAFENYVDICFINSEEKVQTITFRQTLSTI